MFTEGNIIYFDPFYFKNGNTAKPKYFVVLKCLQDKPIVASLPTRKATIPQPNVMEHGCLELPGSNLNCFVIAPDFTVTCCGKSFQFATHLYGHQIDLYETNLMQETYPRQGKDYQVWGKMEDALFSALLDCFRNSASVKRKFKRLL
jgi:hypothetical protein